MDPAPPGDTPEQTRLFLGETDASQTVCAMIERSALVDSTVLITGESGVGKELVAREIHARSARREGPFVPLNCAAIPEALIESELFGHEAGAFTDARQQRRGAFELAHRGTLFLDEVGDLARPVQPKLLRALESGELSRVGGERMLNFDNRVIAATNQRLKSMCREGRFRSDLFYRLCVIEIDVPPLRQRVGDIPLLAEHFVSVLCRKCGRPPVRLTTEAKRCLQSYEWPGNVRQLKHLVERALAMNSGSVLDADCFDLDPVSLPGSLSGLMERDWKTARDGFEAAYAQRILQRHDGNVTRAAKAAGLAPGSLYKILRRLGLPLGRKSS